jgi:hypothetical protein
MYARPLPRGVSLGTLAPTQAGTLWGLIVGLPEANSSGDADGEQGPRLRQPAGRPRSRMAGKGRVLRTCDAVAQPWRAVATDSAIRPV